jgi:hypothetical protein
MHQALTIVDVLYNIFQYTDASTDGSCALVCKAWHQNALDALWNHVDRLERLFKLLGPMGFVNNNLITFAQHHIAPEKWARFFYYANRVQRINFTNTLPAVHRQSFAAVAIARPVLHLFPNLLHLSLTKTSKPSATLPLSALFLHPGLQSLKVLTGYNSTQGDLAAMDNFFQDVLFRAPNIEILDLHWDVRPHVVGPSPAEFLRGLRKLKKLTISTTLLSSDVVTALATCPYLESVTSAGVDPDPPHDLENFLPVVRSNGFPSIKTFSFSAHLWNAARFLQPAFPAHRLRSLRIKSLIFEKRDSVAAFFTIVSELCSRIESLELTVSYVEFDPNITPEALLPDALDFPTMAPLCQCHELQTFLLETPAPVYISDADAIQIASSWPKLQHLNLNVCPALMVNDFSAQANPFVPPVELTFAALPPFALHCPDLLSLSLRMSANIIPADSAFTPFRHLEKFAISVPFSDYIIDELALFLATITPTSCDVVSANPLQLQDLSQFRILPRSYEKVNRVLALLPALRRIHAQYRERLEKLEREVARMSVGPTIN